MGGCSGCVEPWPVPIGIRDKSFLVDLRLAY